MIATNKGFGTPNGVERRAHPRRKICAPAKIREAAGACRQIDASVLDLSRGGCFVETQTPLAVGTAAEIVIDKAAESFAALATVVSNVPGKGMGLEFTSVGAEHFRILGGWLDKSLQNLWIATNRRRGQRISLHVPVKVSGYAEQGARFSEESYTVDVSAHGGLIVLSARVKEGQRLVLSHSQTKAAQECLVVSCKPTENNQLLVGVAFVVPSPRFWLISFPSLERSSLQTDSLRIPSASQVFGQTKELCLQF